MKFLSKVIFISYLASFQIFLGLSEFYFVRHGQTNFNIKKELKNWNMSINDVGVQQIKSLKDSIKELSIRNLFFSPLIRARETKNIIQKYLRVCEVSLPEIKEAQEGLYSEILSLKNSNKCLCSRALKKFLNRLSRGIFKILECPKLSLVVGHGTVYAGICYILDVNTDIWRINNGSLVHFYQNKDGSWQVELINDGSKNIDNMDIN
ncbi:histidine phosphatase family protein [Candidatus Dependentiae bacterium]|nr:histidine phosphatase family protein [Candidatus Dependentiae bacterium]